MTLEARKIRLLMQLRRAGITDTAVLAAIEKVPRELFVPPSFHDQAYENIALPIGLGQTISQPEVVALMTQSLEATRQHTVLEVGTGSGYQAAVLSRVCRRVYSIERHGDLLKQAEARFAELRLHNITSRRGDGSRGWPEPQSFDRIIVTCAAELPPEPLLAQLRDGGCLILPVGGQGRSQELLRLRKTARGVEREELGLVRFVPLVADLPEKRSTG
ncbi:protein-L-isoaspartate(D-aspartate) O-methyltransferase [Tistlia consotensis]|uniref:Protein-L-isoaspartate O-methyltransferase n=1 Tax=Tistlia consotensis USBA 355 TaxID=560819 RepID=A0A1Y6BJH5_9PROT|nr:protein-L-isoaspartate(D-aspartate) O-methyltransferase [Tistlia consotensis]SMF14143.1 protein-L-isoaspartate(D-aspartate) O-methyltransferase [Tistlia consotensis USBA 355]SNR49839.1 protein-L-isoaspartate(D-aspartate) O-methyltransferase [Tistlia consotensis]